jgi:hypothetical protein
LTLSAVALLLIAGWPLCRALDPEARGVRLAGESLLVGSGAASMILFLPAACGVPWSRSWLFGALGLVAVGCAAFAGRRTSPVHCRVEPTGSRAWIVLDIISGTLVAAHLLFASLERPYEWDYFGIWGFKGHLFYVARSIPWPILRDADFGWIQRGHPLFVPLLYDVVAIVSGDWGDRNLGLLTTAFGLAVVLIVRGLVAEERAERWRRSLVTLAVTPAALSMWVGLAEGFLIGFATGGILLVRRGLLRDSPRSISAGAVLLGCAAMTKNEGTAFLVSAAIAIAVSHQRVMPNHIEESGRGPQAEGHPPDLSLRLGMTLWRRLFYLWPAAAVAAPWIVTRSLFHIETDLLAGNLAQREQHLRSAAHIVHQIFATPIDDCVFWWAAIAATAFHWRRAAGFERFLVAVLASQLAFDVLQNFLIPWDPDPHIRYSWNRILDQMAALTAFTASMLIAENFGHSTLGHSARSSPPNGEG